MSEWFEWRLLMANSYCARLKNEKAQGLAEYALMIVLVSAATVAALGILGITIEGVFPGMITSLTGRG